MKINFIGDMADLQCGLEILEKDYSFSISPEGFPVVIEKRENSEIEVGRNGSQAYIKYPEKIHFFRGLGLLLEQLEEPDQLKQRKKLEKGQDFKIIEKPQFVTNGVMIDVSQGNSVLLVESIQRILRKMAVMGLNMFMLYTEDNYVIPGEPYFGYMRGRYTAAQLKACDDYADSLGIEMVPCIQTLAHLIDALKWDCYKDIKEDDDILLVGNEGAYELIEKMISAASAPFRTKRIHIGMDEAWKLGQGNYLLKNGLKEKFDIMTIHLNRVLEITSKYNLQPMIWSDMYFRETTKTSGHYNICEDTVENLKSKVPKEVQLVYWDYYHKDKNFYSQWINAHKALGGEPIFAGGIWSWNSYGVDYQMTFDTTNAALEVCKEQNIREVFATIWGDGGTESNIYANLLGLQLFAEQGYVKKLDRAKLEARFKFCTGCNYEDFMNLSYFDRIPGTTIPETNSVNPSKYLVWQDILMGLFDKSMEELPLKEHYSMVAELMKRASNNNGEFSFIFVFMEKLSKVLALKAELGTELTKLYREKDMEGIRKLYSEDLVNLSAIVEELRVYHRELWHQINLPFGWEVLDIRYGGLLARIDSAGYRIRGYLKGRVSKLEELEEERLYFSGEPGPVMCMRYSRIPSASRLSYCESF